MSRQTDKIIQLLFLKGCVFFVCKNNHVFMQCQLDMLVDLVKENTSVLLQDTFGEVKLPTHVPPCTQRFSGEPSVRTPTSQLKHVGAA